MKARFMFSISAALLFATAASAHGMSRNGARDGAAGDANHVIVGMGSVPAFPGASHHRTIPVVFGSMRVGDRRIELGGTGLKLQLLDSDTFNIGPVANYHLERRSEDGSGRLKQLDDIKAAAELGGFAEYHFGGDRRGQGRVGLSLAYLRDVNDAYSGGRAVGRISVNAVRTSRLGVRLSLSSTWGSDSYMRTYFGVTPAVSARSGLPAYRPSSGLQDVTLGVMADYRLTRHLALVGFGGFTRYVGDAADSPVTHEGTRNSATLGVGLSIGF